MKLKLITFIQRGELQASFQRRSLFGAANEGTVQCTALQAECRFKALRRPQLKSIKFKINKSNL